MKGEDGSGTKRNLQCALPGPTAKRKGPLGSGSVKCGIPADTGKIFIVALRSDHCGIVAAQRKGRQKAAYVPFTAERLSRTPQMRVCGNASGQHKRAQSGSFQRSLELLQHRPHHAFRQRRCNVAGIIGLAPLRQTVYVIDDSRFDAGKRKIKGTVGNCGRWKANGLRRPSAASLSSHRRRPDTECP